MGSLRDADLTDIFISQQKYCVIWFKAIACNS